MRPPEKWLYVKCRECAVQPAGGSTVQGTQAEPLFGKGPRTVLAIERYVSGWPDGRTLWARVTAPVSLLRRAQYRELIRQDLDAVMRHKLQEKE